MILLICTGRALRPGQTRTVHVYRFTMLQTIEQELRVHSALHSEQSYFNVARPVRDGVAQLPVEAIES
jgi:hypothetical protein